MEKMLSKTKKERPSRHKKFNGGRVPDRQEDKERERERERERKGERRERGRGREKERGPVQKGKHCFFFATLTLQNRVAPKIGRTWKTTRVAIELQRPANTLQANSPFTPRPPSNCCSSWT